MYSIAPKTVPTTWKLLSIYNGSFQNFHFNLYTPGKPTYGTIKDLHLK